MQQLVAAVIMKHPISGKDLLLAACGNWEYADFIAACGNHADERLGVTRHSPRFRVVEYDEVPALIERKDQS